MNYLDLALDASEVAVDIFNRQYNSPTIGRIINSLDYNEFNIEMWTNTIYPNKQDWEGKKIGDLKLQVYLFKKDLESLPILSKEKQETLMNACVDLSKSAITYYNQLRSYLAA